MTAEIVFEEPVTFIFPVPVCVPVPAMFPPTDNINPPSFKVPLVSVNAPEHTILEPIVNVAGDAFVLFKVKLDKAVIEAGIVKGPASVPP